MKAIKFTIVAVLVAALGFGLYIIIDPFNKDDSESGSEIVIPEGCDLEWAQQYIDSVYHTIPNGQFQTLKNRRGEMQGNFNNMMTGTPKKCQETVGLMLRNRYQSRFIQMANSEFAEKNWPHYSDIRDMNKTLLAELSQGSQDLKKIESICKEYDQVVYYNNRVKNQSYQCPSTLYDHWNLSYVKNLISNTPSASTPVDHTIQYESSKSENVKKVLYNGHVSFLEEMVDLTQTQIMDNPTKSNYNQVCEIVSREIEQFKNNAASIYSKDYSTVEKKAEQLNKRMDDYEKLLNDERQI